MPHLFYFGCAGAGHGQFASPTLLRSLITTADRIPSQRNTNYSIKRRFPENYQSSLVEDSALDGISDSLDVFGSFEKLTKSNENRYIDHHRQNRIRFEKEGGKRSYSTSSSSFLPLLFSTPSPLPSTASSSSSSSSSTSILTANERRTIGYTPIIDYKSMMKKKNVDLNIATAMNNIVIKKKITYSSSFTIVPTYECFNLCTYCNFRTNVRTDESLMIQSDTVISTLQRLQKYNLENSENRIHEILILSGTIIAEISQYCIIALFN